MPSPAHDADPATHARQDAGVRVASASAAPGAAPAAATAHRLEVTALTRSFGAHTALRDVTLHVNTGEIVGLVGENGAGKSTLLNVLSGTLRRDSGRIMLNGVDTTLSSHRDANAGGVFRLYQEPALLTNLTVYENMFLAHEHRFRRAGLLRRGAMIASCRDILERLDHGHIDPRQLLGAVDFSTRQALDLVRVFALSELLGVANPVILLDEPTSVLSSADVQFLMRRLRAIRHRAAVVFVSHRLSETLEISDRVYVLKDGQVVAQEAARSLTEPGLHELMVGRVRDEAFYKEDRQGQARADAALVVQGLSHPGDFQDVSLTVRSGEVVGIGGVIGSGKSSFGRAVMGALRPVTGTVSIRGAALPARWSSRDMVRAGVGYLPPNRSQDGVIGGFSVSRNTSLARVATGADGRWLVRPRVEHRRAQVQIQRLSIRTRGPLSRVQDLSGGNQQKVALARWLDTGADVFVLDSPTRGLDAGAKEQLYELIRELAAAGAAFLVISDDLLELIGLCNRVLVMKDGRTVTAIDAPYGAKPTECELVAHMV